MTAQHDPGPRPWTLHPGLKWSEALNAAGLSQAYAAQQLTVSTKHLNRILNGHALPSAALTVRFADLVGTSARLLWRMRCDYELDLVLGAEDVTPAPRIVNR